MQAYNKLIDDVKLNEKKEYDIDPERLGKAIPHYTKALLLLKDRLESGRKSAKDATNGNLTVHKKVAKRWAINIGVVQGWINLNKSFQPYNLCLGTKDWKY